MFSKYLKYLGINYLKQYKTHLFQSINFIIDLKLINENNMFIIFSLK